MDWTLLLKGVLVLAGFAWVLILVWETSRSE